MDQTYWDVVVIGSGVSGLSAAKMLTKFGCRALVLESRNRIGGRIDTNRTTLGTVIDLGASWIHGTGGRNPIMELASQNEIVTKVTDYDNNVLYTSAGKEYGDKNERHGDLLFAKILKRLEKYRESQVASGVQDISVLSAIEVCMETMEFTPRDRKFIEYSINLDIEHEYAADAADMSFQRYGAESDFSGPDALFPDGYVQIPELLAEGLDIVFNCCVRCVRCCSDQHLTSPGAGGTGAEAISEETLTTTEVIQTNPYVLLETSEGCFRARRVLVTVPLGVLKAGTIEFRPPLPPAKIAAMEHLHMGIANKVCLRFPSVFWDKEQLINLIADDPHSHLECHNISSYKKDGIPCLMIYQGGTGARRIESQTDEEVLQDVMSMFRRVYGSIVPDPVAHIITRWGQDPHTLGSYSYAGVGATAQDYDALAAPVGDLLYFAGEATSQRYPSTVAGAYLTGERAAREILASIDTATASVK